MKKLILVLTCLLWIVPCQANIIVPEANMPFELIQVEIQPDNDGLIASFSGEFHFTHISPEYWPMHFPVPPDANNISVFMDDTPLLWQFDGGYTTSLPEMPSMTMIYWLGPFPASGAVFRIDCEHSIIERPEEFIYFYPFSFSFGGLVWRHVATTAVVEISLPEGFAVDGIWLDDTPQQYSISGGKLQMTTEFPAGWVPDSELIVSLVPGYYDDCGVLVQGVECVLFQADAGGLYLLDNTGSFGPGDRVRVRGILEPYCVSICMQENGCIRYNSISPCLRCDFNNDGGVNIADFAILALNWLVADCVEPNWCDGVDLNKNGVADSNDLGKFADDWLMCEDQNEAGKPRLSKYYTAYNNPVEPNAPGYTLPLDLNDVGNYTDMDSQFGLEPVAPLLEQNGFAIIEHDFGWFDPNRDDIVKPYEYLRNLDIPLFITADTLLHLYHIQFDETLKDIEEREFIPDINDLTTVLLDNTLALYEQYSGDLKEAARRNVAYLTVAQQLIDPNADVPEMVAGLVASELAKIDAHEGFDTSDIFIYLEDYSQYVPRGHYTRSEALKRYFRTLMWYGRITFLLKGSEHWCPFCEALISTYDAKIQTLQAVLLARSINSAQVGERSGRDIWERMYAITAFYVGLADDLTPYEYFDVINTLFGSEFDSAYLEDEDKFFLLKAELSLLRSPKIYGGTGRLIVLDPITPESLNVALNKTKGMRFMGQRFIPDSYIFQHLVTPEVPGYIGDWDPLPFTLGDAGGGPERCYPRGLDVMAILGSKCAKAILIEEGDTDYISYWLRFNDLKTEFNSFDLNDWNQNLYWGWLYSLRAIISGLEEGYPNFMRTEAWEKKELNAALASWTELRHDTILYAKQSYTPGRGGGPPIPPGYVEPVPEFYGRLLALTQMTRQGLSEFDALSAQAAERLVNLENILSRLIEIANKELVNQELSRVDDVYIARFSQTLEEAVVGVDDTGIKTTLVADVHTHAYEEKVVEEGVGYVDLIIVACPLPDGSIFLTAGPVLSYYEFKQPMSDRLTDEAWRQLLDSPQKPDRPTWFQPLMH